MTLDAFRDAVLGDARRHARRLTGDAEQQARDRVDDAQRQAEDLRDRARQEGREAAERELRRRRAGVRRQAREEVLRARQDALERLRAEALHRLADGAAADTDTSLDQRLEELVRRQLGAGAELESDPDGGVVGRADGRCVDYRLPTLVDRAIRELGGEVEELWR